MLSVFDGSLRLKEIKDLTNKIAIGCFCFCFYFFAVNTKLNRFLGVCARCDTILTKRVIQKSKTHTFAILTNTFSFKLRPTA